jgi:hypothetical protein
MAGRYTTTFRQATDAGLDNAALALEELSVDGALALSLKATEQIVSGAMADGRVSRHEQIDVRAALAVLREAVEQAMRLDEMDDRIARGLCGLHEALAKERAAGRRLIDAA